MHKIFPEYLPLKKLREEKDKNENDDNYENMAKMMDQKVEDELDEEQRENLSIVDIYFCFDQTKLITKLYKRGQLYTKYRG